MTDTDHLTPGQRRTRNATAAAARANRRARQERLAAELRTWGWYVLPPEENPVGYPGR